MFAKMLRMLLRPVTDPLHQLIKEIQMNEAEVLASIGTVNETLLGVDTKVTVLTDMITKVGTETAALLAEIQVLKDETIAAHTTSPALLAAIESIGTRATSISGHVAAAVTAASAVDAAVPDKVAPL